MALSKSSSLTTSSEGEASAEARKRATVHGWLWTIIGSAMLLAMLWEQPDDLAAPALAVLGLGTLDVAAGILVLRRKQAGRALLILSMIGHLALAAWLFYRGQLLVAAIERTPTDGTYGRMMYQTTANAMLGMVVWVVRGLAGLSVVLCSWTASALYRSR